MSESQESDVTGAITKFVSMFVDRACSETGISADHSKSLLSKVPNLVIMQVKNITLAMIEIILFIYLKESLT